MIIGLTGKMAAGKGTVANYLKDKGFVYHSCSDILRLELKEKGIEENIPNLSKIGNQLRTEEGPGVLGKKLLKIIQENKEEKAIADSIRNPAEIEELKLSDNQFILVGVDAPIELRYSRMLSRKRVGDEMTLEEFKKQDFKQLKSDDPNSQQILECFKMADYTIVNNKTLDELHQKIEDILNNL